MTLFLFVLIGMHSTPASACSIDEGEFIKAQKYLYELVVEPIEVPSGVVIETEGELIKIESKKKKQILIGETLSKAHKIPKGFFDINFQPREVISKSDVHTEDSQLGFRFKSTLFHGKEKFQLNLGYVGKSNPQYVSGWTDPCAKFD